MNALISDVGRLERSAWGPALLSIMLAAGLLAAPALHAQEDPRGPGEPPAACVVGTHSDISDGEAETVADLVCEELRALGIDVGRPIAGAEAGGVESAFITRVRRLGRTVLVSVTWERPAGTELRTRRLQLDHLEEIAYAAERLAVALVEDRELEETATVRNQVYEETREPGVRPGHTMVGVGVIAATPLGADFVAAPGLDMRIGYDAAEFAIDGAMRFAGRDDDGALLGLFGVSVGGRYFFSDGNISPYTGGGFEFLVLGVSDEGADGGESGVGIYATGGVEFLRFYRSRLLLDARVSAPFFDVSLDGGRRYVLPMTVGLVFAIGRD